VGHQGDIAHLPYVVNPQKRSASGDGEGHRGGGAVEPVTHVAAEDRSDEALAGGTDKDGATQHGKLLKPAQYLQVSPSVLGEADAWIDDDPFPAYPT